MGAATAVSVLVVLLVVNGGYVYRTQCPHVDGSTETSWRYGISDIVPYVGYSQSGCQVHTATRLLLDAIGIWKLHDPTPSTTGAPSGHQSEYTSVMRASMQSHCVSSGKAASFCRCATDELTRAFSPVELSQISSASRFDQLPSALARRARDETSAINQDC